MPSKKATTSIDRLMSPPRSGRPATRSGKTAGRPRWLLTREADEPRDAGGSRSGGTLVGTDEHADGEDLARHLRSQSGPARLLPQRRRLGQCEELEDVGVRAVSG